MKKHISNIGNSVRRLLMLMAGLLTCTLSFAITKDNADTAYRQGKYQQAITDYQELLKEGVSPELYYNLGNAYYRSDNLAQAIVAYERAAQLSPGSSDIRFNLQFARAKTIDKIVPDNEMLFVTWYKRIVNFTSVDNWARAGIVAVVLALLLMLAYLFGSQLLVRKIGFYGSGIALLLFIVTTFFAWQQKQNLERHCGAIIMAPSVAFKQPPVPHGTAPYVLHEASPLDVADKSMKSWYGIQVGDGREGWIPASQVEVI